jgi:hypothetical protein
VNELVIIVEGGTEQTFVRDQLSAHLALRGIVAWGVLPGRHRKHGGVKKWAVARDDMLRALREGRHVSTMFDYYAMPRDWPGRAEADAKPWRERARFVEQAVQQVIAAEEGAKFDPRRFHPYVQLHEFEALLFADVQILAHALVSLDSRWQAKGSVGTVEKLATEFDDILRECGEPEAINDSYDTCPSRRIQRLVKAYDKASFGPIVSQRIGLERLRARCPHFGEWLGRLEGIGAG